MFATIAAAALNPIATSRRWRRVGFVLVALPLPAVVAAHLAFLHGGRLDQALFGLGVVAFACGAVLVLSREEGRDEGGSSDDPGPNWWPDFEREFRTYVRTLPSPRRGRLIRS